jgi:hypothetical protein
MLLNIIRASIADLDIYQLMKTDQMRINKDQMDRHKVKK